MVRFGDSPALPSARNSCLAPGPLLLLARPPMPSSNGDVATKTLVAAPCSAVLYLIFDSSNDSAYGAEAWTAASASASRCRFKLVVATGPGWTALAVMPSVRQRRVASTAKRTLAVFDCP